MAQRDNEYKRCGTANVFCAVEPKVGRHFTFATPDRSAAELAPVLAQLISRYPCAHTIHLVMDNLNIHGRKTLTDYFGEEQGGDLWNRLTVHYTPKHGSWLNQAEIEISLFARQCLGQRRIPSLSLLRRETRAWNRMVNRNQGTIDWRFTRTKARQKFNYDKTLLCGHRSRTGTRASRTALLVAGRVALLGMPRLGGNGNPGYSSADVLPIAFRWGFRGGV